jgi:predicted RNase H-like nuclease (RuvC/YqgF family)
MNEHQISRVLIALAFSVATVMSCGVHAQSLDDVLGVRESTTQDGRKSQAKIDEIKEDTRDLLTQYKTVMKIVDGLRVYNQQQERLIANQQAEMKELNESIDDVTEIERQIGPLIQRMIDNLEKFVELDLPFLMSERRDRIEFLKDTLDRADVSVAEKFSQVLQAYQVENTYGSTIEAYTDFVEIDGNERQVDILKWGRVALVFQTPDGEITGAWNTKTRSWEILGDEFRTGVRDGLRIARKTMTADLVILPVPAPESN